ncbi:hypothetical protein [Streptomyces sp. NPDC052042]|uniref:hypothetical protein n=1 Tax=Streptomyces sp. NPDC052042 TaxID=3365683 RepID=UPI0037D3F441
MSLTALPETATVPAKTVWSALEHAYGTAEKTPAQLVALLDADQGVRSMAIDRLDHAVLHQGTLYSATAPAARYVAGMLTDSRTAVPVGATPRTYPGPLHAELLDWLYSAANEVTDETEATSRHYGSPPEDYPPFVRFREIRPMLHAAVSRCLDDTDPHASRSWTTHACSTVGRIWSPCCGRHWLWADGGNAANGRSKPLPGRARTQQGWKSAVRRSRCATQRKTTPAIGPRNRHR